MFAFYSNTSIVVYVIIFYTYVNILSMKNLDLSKIFGSNCRTKILEKFLLEYESGNNDGFHMRLLSRDLGEQINSIKRELDNLSALGMLKHKTQLRKKIFSINPSFPYIDQFVQIFLKHYNPLDNIKHYFKDKIDLEVVIVNKEIQYKLTKETKSLLDIFLIWDIDRSEFASFLSGIFFNRKVKYAIISTEDFYKRLEYWDKLISNILSEPWNLLLKDNLKVKEKMR